MCSAQKLQTLGRESLRLGPPALWMGILLHSPHLVSLAELDVVAVGLVAVDGTFGPLAPPANVGEGPARPLNIPGRAPRMTGASRLDAESPRSSDRGAIPSAYLHPAPHPGSLLSAERQVDEGRNAHQIEARGQDIAARDGDRLDGLVDGASPDCMNLDPAVTPDDSGDSPGYQDRLGGGRNFEHLFGRLAFVRHPSKSSSSMPCAGSSSRFRPPIG